MTVQSRRRADYVAALPRGVPLREGRLLLVGAGRDQRAALPCSSPSTRTRRRRPGSDLAYFQFDGVTNDANGHRHISNLFDVKQKAIDVMHAAGIDIIPVTRW